MAILLLALQLLVGSILLGYGTLALVRWPALGLAVVGIYIVFMKDIAQLPSASFGGINVDVVDVTSMILVLSAIIRVSRGRTTSLRSHSTLLVALLIVMLSFLMFSLARGFLVYGLQSAVNEMRNWIYLVAMFAWTVTLDPHSRRFRGWVEAWAIWVAIGLILVALSGIAANGLVSTSSAIILDADGNEMGARPINAGQAITLALCAIVIMAKGHRDRRWSLESLAWVSLAVVVLVQHRSVWAATIGGLLAFLLLARLRDKVRMAVVIFYAGVSLLVLVAIGTLVSFVDLIGASATDSRTYDGRVAGWLALLDDWVQQGPLAVFFGLPAGHGWQRLQGGFLVVFSPHNWYVEVVLRLGVIALAAVVLLLITAIVKGVRFRNDPPVTALLVAVMIYIWPYGVNWFWVPMATWAIVIGFAGKEPDGSASPSRPSASRFHPAKPKLSL